MTNLEEEYVHVTVTLSEPTTGVKTEEVITEISVTDNVRGMNLAPNQKYNRVADYLPIFLVTSSIPSYVTSTRTTGRVERFVTMYVPLFHQFFDFIILYVAVNK